MRTFAAIVWRNLIRLLLTCLAVALVTWLLAWYANDHHPNTMCGAMADGTVVYCE